MLIALLLAPGIGAWLMEREAGRPAARVALLCGAAMAVSPVVVLWQSGAGVGGAVTAASDAAVLAGCWAAQGAGWLMAQLAPVVVRLALDAHTLANIARLRGERRRYEVEWGITDVQDSALEPQGGGGPLDPTT